ncbi:MAG: phage holin family protein [cyanobacterium endosymbiont of Rhopalodia sterrenbergii]
MYLLITWLLTALSLLIVAQLPIGVEVDNFFKALVAAIVFGILNAIVRPILFVLTIPITILTLGLFSIVLNTIIFGLAAALVKGFRLKYGFWSALFGSFFLSIVNSLLSNLMSN